MAIERVKEFFRKYGIEERIKEFAVSSATVELAAAALGCEPDRIAKSLSFRLSDGCILIVASGSSRVDNHKFKEAFSEKAKMLPFDEVETEIGHAVGGVCPFAVNDGIRVYLDTSLKQYKTVFPACGSGNSAVEMSIEELEKYSGFTAWVDVCKE